MSGVMKRRNRRRAGAAGLLTLGALLAVAAVNGEDDKPAIPNGARFPNPAGASSTYSTSGSIDLTGPFFQSLGSNGRACGSCHQPSDGMSVSAEHVQDRFEATAGLDPIFRTVEGPTATTASMSQHMQGAAPLIACCGRAA